MGEHAQRTQRARQQARHLVAGGVLHDAAAAGKGRAFAVHGAEAQEVVAHGAAAVASRAAGIGHDRATDGGPLGFRHVDRQALSMGSQLAVQGGQGHAGLDRDGQIVCRIIDDAIQTIHFQADARPRRLHAVILRVPPPIG